MNSGQLTGKISYRVSEEEEREIQNEAEAEGISTHDWCRNAVREKLQNKGRILNGSERLIYEEIARVRFLLGSGFSLMATHQLSDTEWRRLLGEADKNGTVIADTLLNLRNRNDR